MNKNKFVLVLTDIENGNKNFLLRTVVLSKKLNPESLVANILESYNKLDYEINKGLTSPLCEKGCSDCCISHFAITQSEFFTIIYTLGLGENLIRYSEKSKEMIKKYWLPNEIEKNNEINKTIDLPPCIFVDETEKHCTIYEVRPTVCRMYGSILETTDCAKTKNNKKVKNKLLKYNKKYRI